MGAKKTDNSDLGDYLARLADDEDLLRQCSPVEGALGRNASDYHNMWSLFMQCINRANALNTNPNAFSYPNGSVNDKALNAWTKMVATSRSILEGLNKMRNNDKMMSVILDRHTKNLSQNVAVHLGLELKNILEMVDRNEPKEEIAIQIKRVMYKRLPEIFIRSATDALEASKDEFGLLH